MGGAELEGCVLVMAHNSGNATARAMAMHQNVFFCFMRVRRGIRQLAPGASNRWRLVSSLPNFIALKPAGQEAFDLVFATFLFFLLFPDIFGTVALFAALVDDGHFAVESRDFFRSEPQVRGNFRAAKATMRSQPRV